MIRPLSKFIYYVICIFASTALAQLPPAPPMPSKTNCSVPEFKSIALTESTADQRSKKITAWLNKNAPLCTYDQLMLIYNNRTLWLGTADSQTIAGILEKTLDAKDLESKEKAYQEYLDKDGKKTLSKDK